MEPPVISKDYKDLTPLQPGDVPALRRLALMLDNKHRLMADVLANMVRKIADRVEMRDAEGSTHS